MVIKLLLACWFKLTEHMIFNLKKEILKHINSSNVFAQKSWPRGQSHEAEARDPRGRGRGRMPRGRGQQFWPRGRVGLEALTSLYLTQ